MAAVIVELDWNPSRSSDRFVPFPDGPAANDAVEDEGVTFRERFRSLARSEDRHGALVLCVRERPDHQQRTLMLKLFPASDVFRKEPRGSGADFISRLVEQDILRHLLNCRSVGTPVSGI